MCRLHSIYKALIIQWIFFGGKNLPISWKNYSNLFPGKNLWFLVLPFQASLNFFEHL
jgi:hypothetical protein